MDVNRATILGRLTRDPEMRTTPNGIVVCQLSVATNYVTTNPGTGQKNEQVEYHNVVLWRKLGEIAGQYLKKGRRVYIEGRIQSRSWDGQDGTKKNRTEIIGENMIMLDGGTGAGMGGGNNNSGGGEALPSSMPMKAQNNTASSNSSYEEELPTIQADEDIRIDDIPF